MLSSNSLTRAKHENGAKHDQDQEALFKPDLHRGSKENYSLPRGLKSVNFREHRAEQGAKFSSFREIGEFLNDCEIPIGGGHIPTPL